MSGAKVLYDLHRAMVTHGDVADPGDAGTIRLQKSHSYCNIVSAGSETRTVAAPTAPGQTVQLNLKTDGGDVTVTASAQTIVLNDAGDYVVLVGVQSGSSVVWKQLKSGGVTGETLAVDTISEATAATGVTIDGVVLKDTTVDVNGTADALILDADADTTISAPTDDQIDIEIAGADDFTFTANSFNVLTGSKIDLADSASVTFGTGDDVKLDWDGTWLEAQTIGAQAIWSGAPSPADPSFDSIAHCWKEDFEQDPVDWTVTADSTGTAVSGDRIHGSLLITNAATADNDATQAEFDNEVVRLVSGKEFWWETRIRCSAGDATNLDFFVGFQGTEDLTGVADNMPANGIGFHKDDDDTNIDASSSDNGTNIQQAAVGTLVDATWVRLGMHFDGGASGAATITPYVNGVAGTALPSVTYGTMTELAPVAMVRNGDATTTQTLEVDYFKVVQIR